MLYDMLYRIRVINSDYVIIDDLCVVLPRYDVIYRKRDLNMLPDGNEIFCKKLNRKFLRVKLCMGKTHYVWLVG